MAKNGSLWTVLILINRVTALQRSLRVLWSNTEQAIGSWSIPDGSIAAPVLATTGNPSRHRSLPCSRQPGKHCSSFLQVRGFKPFSKPVIHRCQQLPGFDLFALAQPQAAEAHGSPQLQRFGVLAARHVQGLLKTDFRLWVGLYQTCQQ